MAEEARTQGQVWEIINKERKMRRRVNEEIEMSEWKRFFMELLVGVEKRVRRGIKEGRERDEENELRKMEIERVISGLKNGKAAVVDGIASEIWKFGGEEVREWGREFCNRV